MYVVAGRKDGGNGTGEGYRGELGKESIRGGTPAPTRGAGISAGLAHFHTGLGAAVRAEDVDVVTAGAGGQHHAFGDAEFHLARG